MNKRTIYAPEYYNKFKCTTGKCRHSCCIGWEICIDEETLDKYKKHSDIMETVSMCDDGACFELKEDGRCPHLNRDGLCNIILSHTDNYLSQICANHPRFFNEISGERTEAGLGIVCEEACRIILENENTFSLQKIEEIYEDYSCETAEDFDPIFYRDKIICTMECKENSFWGKISKLQKEFELFRVCAEEWVERFLLLEVLDKEWHGLLGLIKKEKQKTDGGKRYDKYYERLFVYFVYRHVSIADSLYNLKARLSFCILSVEMIKSIFEGQGELSLNALIDIARRYSAEIEYSEENTDDIIFDMECML